MTRNTLFTFCISFFICPSNLWQINIKVFEKLFRRIFIFQTLGYIYEDYFLLNFDDSKWYDEFIDHIKVTALSVITAKITVISPNFLRWEVCGKAQVPHSFGRITRNYAEPVPFHKISTPGN